MDRDDRHMLGLGLVYVGVAVVMIVVLAATFGAAVRVFLWAAFGGD